MVDMLAGWLGFEAHAMTLIAAYVALAFLLGWLLWPSADE